MPAIIVAQSQLNDVPAVAQQFGVAPARKLIREGAFTGLRDNVRAIGEFVEPELGKDEAKARVNSFFKALEAVDQALFLVRAI